MREQEIERDQCIPAAPDIFTLFSVLLLHTVWPQSVRTMDCVHFSRFIFKHSQGVNCWCTCMHCKVASSCLLHMCARGTHG